MDSKNCLKLLQFRKYSFLKTTAFAEENAQKLPQELFIPCHRSYIVNLMHVRCLKRTELFLSDGKRLPVSRPYGNTLNAAFDSYYQEGCRYDHVEPI